VVQPGVGLVSAATPIGMTAVAGRRSAMRRASMATTSGSMLPIANAASIAAATTVAAMVRCSSNAPIRARVPAPSPRRRRASVQNRS
jgi:spore maturation protein SpmA